ncbi:DUF1835 domain-containing protein [Echinicola shivajiensis]|uniref:DUF1835 domain-containing protein n=1 Tax=Echinicola shivajiensis TaxID=1035916 RepID=UPI001BFC7262|nr:DUF1835 domain-containing protein [Echinicola shivajiensis]
MIPNSLYLVFGFTSIPRLKVAFEKLSITGTIICLDDDLRFGPIDQLDQDQGINKRTRWLSQHTFNELDRKKHSSSLNDDIRK